MAERTFDGGSGPGAKLDRATETLKRCYRKHCLGDESIGWDELGDEIADLLAEFMGDAAFRAWVMSIGGHDDDRS